MRRFTYTCERSGLERDQIPGLSVGAFVSHGSMQSRTAEAVFQCAFATCCIPGKYKVTVWSGSSEFRPREIIVSQKRAAIAKATE